VIADSEDKFWDQVGRGRLNGLNRCHVAAMERLQPYRRVAWTRVLRELSNPDKHRHLLPVFGHLSGFQLQFVSLGGGGPEVDPAKGETVIHIPIENADPETQMTEMQMYAKIDAYVAFQEGEPTVPILRILHSQVAQLIQAFKPEF
jgi:hypothetical protein